MPVSWLRPVCEDTWPIVLASAMAGALPLLFHRRGDGAWSLSMIALTQAIFQAWCYNTGSHPAHNPFQIWGILPATDAGLYYTAASNLLNGQQITAMAGARHPYPLLLAVLLKIFRHDFRSITLLFTILMALATWSAFEVIRLRLGGLTATVYLVCVTFYIRIHCAGLFMTEQMALLYSLCAVALLVESIVTHGKAKIVLYCGGLFLLTQALNARPAAYMTLPFLVLASWELFRCNLKAQGKMVVLSAVAVIASLLLHSMTYYWVVASRAPSNAWFCIYGLLNGGTWVDGRNHAEKLWRDKASAVPSDRAAAYLVYAQALRLLRENCLTEIGRHPGKLLDGTWRALRFLWSKNTPFRSPIRKCLPFGLQNLLVGVQFSGLCSPWSLAERQAPRCEAQDLSALTGLIWLRCWGYCLTSLRTALGWGDAYLCRHPSSLLPFARFGVGGLYS